MLPDVSIKEPPKARAKQDDAVRGWCCECAAMNRSRERDEATGKHVCPNCGTPLKPSDQLSADELAMVQMQEWFAQVNRQGLNGPSPTMAAEELGCSRSMIDRLVEKGVLEKSEFTFKDRKLVIISQASVAKAKTNREKTGNWTGHPIKRGA